jgi:hypothetical protein
MPQRTVGFGRLILIYVAGLVGGAQLQTFLLDYVETHVIHAPTLAWAVAFVSAGLALIAATFRKEL